MQVASENSVWKLVQSTQIDPDMTLPVHSETASQPVRIGDIVSLETVLQVATSPSERTEVRYFLEAEGIGDQVFRTRNASDSLLTRFSLSLFRIEACLVPQNGSKTFPKKLVKEHAIRTFGSTVKFGTVLQFCHIHSEMYLCFEENRTSVTGAVCVKLGSRMEARSWITVVHEVEDERRSQVLTYGDSVNLSASTQAVECYLGIIHFSSETGSLRPEVVASPQGTWWRLNFISAGEGLKVYSPVVLKHSDLDMCLSNAKVQVADARKEVLEAVLIQQQDPGCYWMLEAADPDAYGDVVLNRPYYLRHIATQHYLSSELRLIRTPSNLDQFSFESKSHSLKPGTTLIEMKNCKNERVEEGGAGIEREENGQFLSPQRAAERKRPLKLYPGSRTSKAGLFLFEEIDPYYSKFASQVSEFLPNLFNLKKALQSRGENEANDETLKRLTQFCKCGITTLRDTLAEMESRTALQRKQTLLIGLNLHLHLVDVLTRFSLLISNNSASPLEAESSPRTAVFKLCFEMLFPEAIETLTYMALENQEACKALSALNSHIFQLFSFDKTAVAFLLGVIYRFVSLEGEEAQVHLKQWMDRVQSVSQENVEKQRAYLMVLRRFVEDGDGDVDEAVHPGLIERLLEGEQAVQLLRLKLVTNTPYIQFLSRVKLTVQQFLSRNQNIGKYSKLLESGLWFSLLGVGELEDYANYISEAILLLRTACKNSIPQVKDCVMKQLGFDSASLISVCGDLRVNVLIRAAALLLYETLFLNIQTTQPSSRAYSDLTFTPVSTNFNAEWDEFLRLPNENLKECVKLTLEFWLEHKESQAESSPRDILRFNASMLRVTYTLINRRHVTLLYMKAIYSSVCLFLINFYKGNSDLYPESDGHWSKGVASIVLKENNNITFYYNLRETLDLAVTLLEIMNKVETRFEVERCASLYYEKPLASPSEIKSVLETPESHSTEEVLSRAKGLMGTSFLQVSNQRNPSKPDFTSIDLNNFLCTMVFSNPDLNTENRNDLISLLRQQTSKFMKIGHLLSLSVVLTTPEEERLHQEIQHLSGRFTQKEIRRLLRDNEIQDIQDWAESLLRLLCWRTTDRTFLRTIQTMCHNSGISDLLLFAWHISTQFRFPQIQLLLVNCLFYIVLHNPNTRKRLRSDIDSSFFVLEIPETAWLIREATNFVSLRHENAAELIGKVLDSCVSEPRLARARLLWIIELMKSAGDGAKPDLQVLVSLKVVEFMHVNSEVLNREVNEYLLLVLSLCARVNSAVQFQLREKYASSRLLAVCEEAETPLSFSASLHLYYELYLVGDRSSTSDLVTVLTLISKWIRVSLTSCKLLPTLAKTRGYENVYDQDDASGYDCRAESDRVNSQEANVWRMMLSGSPWEQQLGLLPLITSIASTRKFPSNQMTELYRNLISLLSEVLGAIQELQSMHSSLIFTFLTKSITDAQSALEASIQPLARHESNVPVFEDVSSLDLTARPLLTYTYSQVPPTSAGTIELEIIDSEDDRFPSFVSGATQLCGDLHRKEMQTLGSLVLRTDPISYMLLAALSANKLGKIIAATKLLRHVCDPEHRPALYQILSNLLTTINNKAKVNEVFIRSGWVLVALRDVVGMETEERVRSALDFLVIIMDRQSEKFQDWLLGQLKEPGMSDVLFLQVQLLLDSELERTDNNNPTLLTEKEKNLFSRFLARCEDPVAFSQEVVRKLIKLLKACCDNCHEGFQCYMNAQTNEEDVNRPSINLVQALARFVVRLTPFVGELPSALQLLVGAFDTLVDFVSGPCSANQIELGSDVQLVCTLNALFGKCRKDGYKQDVDLLEGICDMLLALLEGEPATSVHTTLITFLDIGALVKDLKALYGLFIKSFQEKLLLEQDLQDEDQSRLVQVSFNLFIFLISLRDLYPSHPDLSLLQFEDKPPKDYCPFFWLPALDSVPQSCFSFFASNVGYVEVERDTIESCYFPIPFKCKFLTYTTKQHVILDASRGSHQEKIEDFLDLIPLCKVEMEHQQALHRLRYLKWTTKGWETYGWISYLLILVINVMMLVDTQSNIHITETGGVTMWLGAAQILFAFLCAAAHLIEYTPNLIMERVIAARVPLDLDIYMSLQHNESLLLGPIEKRFSEAGVKSFNSLSTSEKLRYVARDWQVAYNVLYLSVSALSIAYPFLNALLLLDIAKRSQELVNILMSITLNKRQLILTALFGVMLIYIFSVFAYVKFPNYYGENSSNTYCSTLWQCFSSTLYEGIRSGGGIGDAIASPKLDEGTEYWLRMTFDLLFFMIVIIITLNVVFGIIIDTFGELRDQRNQLLEDMNQNCFVCGVNRTELELKGNGWAFHFMNEHSPFAYLAFIVYLQGRELSECSGLEKYAKELVQANDTSFLPSSSRCLRRRKAEEDVVDDQT